MKHLLIVLLFVSSNAVAQVAAIPGRCAYHSDVTVMTRPVMLRNLPGVRVLVGEMIRWNQEDSLRDSLRAGIEQVLAGAGIHVLSEAECSRTPGSPSLLLKTEAMDSEGQKVVLEMRERACLIRSPQTCILVTNFRLETSYRIEPALFRPEGVPENADSIRAARQEEQTRCTIQEATMLQSIARELAREFVGAYKHENPD
ncbi:MAG TPA: hypothetical protein VER38_02215 [Candidatus Eisenbacteria bacterium]|nr:hypothetical protein [Candidatus Eisenbacteria bacterium]